MEVLESIGGFSESIWGTGSVLMLPLCLRFFRGILNKDKQLQCLISIQWNRCTYQSMMLSDWCELIHKELKIQRNLADIQFTNQLFIVHLFSVHSVPSHVHSRVENSTSIDIWSYTWNACKQQSPTSIEWLKLNYIAWVNTLCNRKELKRCE